MQLGRPVFFKRLGAPGAEAFAVLFALESFARALLVTMLPVEALRYLGDAGGVSSAFFACSLCALTASLGIPLLDRKGVVSGKRVEVRVDLGGRRLMKN